VIDDVVLLVCDLVALIKAGEVEEAARRVGRAGRAHSAAAFTARQATLHEVNRALHAALRQREALLAAVDALPETERPFARMQIEEICAALLDYEIVRLRSEKRRLALPKRS